MKLKKYEVVGLPAHCKTAYAGTLGTINLETLTDKEAAELIKKGARFLQRKTPFNRPKKTKESKDS